MSLTLLASLANFTLPCLFVSPIEREIAVKNQRFFLLRNLGLTFRDIGDAIIASYLEENSPIPFEEKIAIIHRKRQKDINRYYEIVES
jgi:hypothetical protein